MLKRDHQKIMRETRRRHEEEIARATAYWEAEAVRMQEIADRYAQELDRLDKILIQQTAALQVIRLDPQIREFLLAKDPKALAQVAEAAELAPEYVIEAAQAPAPVWDAKAVVAGIMAEEDPPAALVRAMEDLVGTPGMSQKVKALGLAYAEAQGKAQRDAQEEAQGYAGLGH